jgi:hypothetical protein
MAIDLLHRRNFLGALEAEKREHQSRRRSTRHRGDMDAKARLRRAGVLRTATPALSMIDAALLASASAVARMWARVRCSRETSAVRFSLRVATAPLVRASAAVSARRSSSKARARAPSVGVGLGKDVVGWTVVFWFASVGWLFEELQPFVRKSGLANDKSVFEFLPSGFVHGQSIISCWRSVSSRWADARGFWRVAAAISRRATCAAMRPEPRRKALPRTHRNGSRGPMAIRATALSL